MKLRAQSGWTTLALFLFPAWAVKSAPMQSRMLWVGVVLFFAFLGVMATVIKTIGPTQTKIEPDPTSPLLRRRRLEQAWICGVTLVLAEFSAIAFTYAEPKVGPIGSYGTLVSSLGANLFPVVAKYATALQPPLPSTQLFRVQSIVSIFMLAVIPCFIAFIRSFLAMSDSDWRLHFESTNGKRPSDFLAIGMILFAIVTTAVFFFGWFEFEEPIKKCIIQATCYARGDDLLIFAAAGMKAVAVFGFPLGAIGMVMANRTLAQANIIRKNKD